MLKASGLGKIVNFYTRTKRVQPEITRQANQLIDKWSKPILRAAGIASGSATGRMAATGHTEEESYGPGEGSGVITVSAKQLKEKEELMQYALEAQREVAEGKKGSRRPNVIVSVHDLVQSSDKQLGSIACRFAGTLVHQSASFTTHREEHCRAGEGRRSSATNGTAGSFQEEVHVGSFSVMIEPLFPLYDDMYISEACVMMMAIRSIPS